MIKTREDELAHLKLQLDVHQDTYKKSYGNKRKAVHSRIESLLGEIDAKSDGLYTLYSVLGGAGGP